MGLDLICAYGQHRLYFHFGFYLLDSPHSLKDCLLLLFMLERRIGSRRKKNIAADQVGYINESFTHKVSIF